MGKFYRTFWCFFECHYVYTSGMAGVEDEKCERPELGYVTNRIYQRDCVVNLWYLPDALASNHC